MNAPLKEITLADKYTHETGNIYLTGTQALVRLALIQRRRDLDAGLNTAGFISGYRGSPMTVVDNELWRAKNILEEHHVHFNPGMNENLAMTSIWGTQQVGFFGDAKYDGVYGLWYGKGPGLDQTIDGLRKANENGTTKHGGVLVMAGDDPYQRSTYDAYYSELLFEDLWIPVLYPADIQDVLDFGLIGIEMSRFTGSYIGYKLLPETIETASSVNADHNRIKINIPEFQFPPGGVNARHPDIIYAHEERIVRYKIPAAIAFARANNINQITHDCPNPRLGIVAAGMMWRVVLQAMRDLGITEEKAESLGIRILKIGMPFPIDEQTYAEFAEGLDEVLVIDDKREQTENAFKKICYDWPKSRRPRIVGRKDEEGAPLVRNFGELTADDVAKVIAERVTKFHTDEKIESRLRLLRDVAESHTKRKQLNLARLPYFCPGCPHNSSTKTPEGSKSFGGVGCHWMATWMDRDVHLYTHMGGEGAQWIGQAPFVSTEHWFQNVGDGTYFHSGSLGLRAAVAAGVNMTFKILYNDAVAMTGGQPVDGQLTVPQIARQARDEGIERIAVVTDEPEKEYGADPFPSGVAIHHRRELEQVQRELREVEGVSVLIYDQTCAAEKRRRRKRGEFPDPPKRLFINDRVCEGCGDCGQKSNCLAVEPYNTEFGPKRKINQSTCNKDYSCNDGFCPSFVTVHGGKLRKGKGIGDDQLLSVELPDPELPKIGANDDYGVLITGVGGTGVVTIGALMGMAAHIDGKGVSIVDQMGFAQKGGPVMTHVRFAQSSDKIHSVRINAGHAHAVLGCDMLVAGGDYALMTMHPEKTAVVLNTHEAITGDFTRENMRSFPSAQVIKRITDRVGEKRTARLNATKLATELLGDSIASNLFLVGYAWQMGLIPLSEEALHNAIELNGVAVDWNKKAFRWGRLSAHDFDAVLTLVDGNSAKPDGLENNIDALVRKFADELTSYQDEKYAQRYLAVVEDVRMREKQLGLSRSALSVTVAKYAYKLMAYKDEYEVARLFTDSAFKQKLDEQFEGDYRLEFNLAPPLLAKKDPNTGVPRKMQFGPWMMTAYRFLSAFKGLRGTPFDPFGHTAERKKERRIISEYQALIAEILEGVTAENYDLAVELASVPDLIRGYGHIKERNVLLAEERKAELLEKWRSIGATNNNAEELATASA